MQYGFAIDQRTCIGCHACTVACKTEHEVPVGQFRTWLKYVEKGEFPATTREFGVMRCNHCTDAPCVKICPTESLFKREDGIVDFDNEPDGAIASLDNRDITIVDREGPRIRIAFDRAAITAPELLARAGRFGNVRDMSIEEPHIEDVIRQMYEGVVSLA